MNPSASSTVISLKDLWYSYDGAIPKAYKGGATLRDLNLKVESGEVLGVVGPNGGGKTTLLRLLCGFIKPTQGSVKLWGHSPRSQRHRIGYVPQFSSFPKDFPATTAQLVEAGTLGAKSWFGVSRKKLLTSPLWSQLGLESLAHLPIKNLSGGQLQRALILRALISKPDLLLLDEPTSSIDAHGEHDLCNLLMQLSRQSTIVVVSHDVGFISPIVSHIACVQETLTCHQAKNLSPESLAQLYPFSVNLIEHSHNHHEHKPGKDHDD